MTQTVPAPSLPPDLVHLLETYCIGRKLGGGSFGTVRAASHIKTNEPVAIKIISRARMQEEKGAEDKVRREINIMRLLRHPHIVRLYEVIETERDIYLIMEYVASGELFDFLNVRGRLHEGAARRFFQQLITGIEACHAAGVVHRDLKPENLLLTADGDSEHADLKIADFGLSNVLRDGHFLHTSCGSPNYAAPEVIAGRQYAGPEVDVWSAGCILFALLAGRLPFDDGNVGRLFRAIKAGAFTLPTHLSLPARDLLKRMLTVDPLHRITIEEIRQHPWFAPGLPDYLAVPMPALGLHGLPPLPDPRVLGQLTTLGLDAQAAAKAVQRRQHSPPAVAYHLLFDALQRRAGGPLVLPPAPTGAALPTVVPPVQRAPGGGQWLPGLPLRIAGGAAAAVAALLSALLARSCSWKRTALYTYRCRAAAASAFAGRGHSRTPAAALQNGVVPEQRCIKFEVQLYTIAEATYLVDMQRLQGSLPCYLDLCSALLSHIATLAANPQRNQQHQQALQQHQAQQQHEQQQQQQQQLLELQRRQAALAQEAYRLLQEQQQQEQQAGRLQDAQLTKQRHSPSPPRGHQRHQQQQQQQQQHLLEQRRLQQQAAAAQLPSLEAAFAHGAANGLPNGLHNGLPDGLPNGLAAHGAAANGGCVTTANGLPNGRHNSPNGVHSSVVTSGGGAANGRAHAHAAPHSSSSSSSGLQVTSGGTHVPSRRHSGSPAPPVRRCGRHSLDASSQSAAGYGATGYAVANGGHMHG